MTVRSHFLLVIATISVACSSDDRSHVSPSSGGDTGWPGGNTSTMDASGGSAHGGMSNGEVASGGVASGGVASGGVASGGVASGGVASGGVASGGVASGGVASGGVASGGVASGGVASGGATNKAFPCWSGAMVTWTASDYISRKWARWPIPNPVVTTLPNPMSYTETEVGVLDGVTGLVWEQSTSDTGTTWQDALSRCEALGDGWSLPTRIELTTVLHHDRDGSKIDTSVFTFGASAGWNWASTPWVVNERRGLTGDAALSWFVNFALGDSNNSLSQTNGSGRSRCVRVQQTMELPALHYTVSTDEVTDNHTCLTWQRGGSGTTPTHTREQAIEYCSGLSLGGHSWRLPSLNELASIVDDVPTGDVSPAIDHEAFPNTSPDQKYWSSSGYNSPADSYWTLNFEDGYTQRNDPYVLANVRCVR